MKNSTKKPLHLVDCLDSGSGFATMDKEKILIIMGAGGFAREVASWVQQSWNNVNLVFYSDIGGTSELLKEFPVVSSIPESFHGCKFLVAVGDPETKAKLWHVAIANKLVPCPPLIHPTSVIGMANLWPGVIICPCVVITTNVIIKFGVILNLGVTVGHDTEIGSFVTVSPGANISGNVKIHEKAYIGTGASIREKVSIGPLSVLGMGAALTKDLPGGEVWGGVPAKQIQKISKSG